MEEKLNYKKAQNSALKLLKECGYVKPPIDPVQIAKMLGVSVHSASFQNQDVSGLYDFEKNIVYINNKDSVERQTFTIAHEIGHLKLHSEWVKSSDYKVLLRSPHDGDPKEIEANTFAADLLVPKKMLNEYRDIASRIELARAFGVSIEVVNNRLNLESKYF
jgi:Zn-dependent peptidase ImmA (M78 family)